MKSERKIFLILLIILLIPAILFFLKPELNLQNKFIKFSWREGFQEIRTAINTKNPGMLTNKVYGNIDAIFKSSFLNQKVDLIYGDYLMDSKNKARKFIAKCKTFIS